MSDRGALAAALEEMPQEQTGEQGTAEGAGTEDREQGSGDRGQEPVTLTPALSQRERETTAERIRQSELLPVGLRTRLAELVLAEGSAATEQAIRAVEASLPGALRIAAGDVARPEHPAGDVFFHGDADELSEQAAEAMARDQLSRSGMLRGQRARD